MTVMKEGDISLSDIPNIKLLKTSLVNMDEDIINIDTSEAFASKITISIL